MGGTDQTTKCIEKIANNIEGHNEYAIYIVTWVFIKTSTRVHCVHAAI